MQARTQRAELAARGAGDAEGAKEAEARSNRMEVLKERQREIERDQRLELAGKKNIKGRDEDRDVSERIALGQVAQPTSQEAMYDARLFNQSAGMDSGYHGGSDEKCAIYDKALFADRSQAGVYKFDKDRMEQNEGRLAHIGGGSSKLGKSKFAGAEDGPEAADTSERNAPVEFDMDEDDSVRQTAPASGSGRDRGRDRSRSRKPRRGPRDGDNSDDDFGLDGLLEETKKRR